MKLQKQVSRRLKNKEYAKYVVVVPPQMVKELGWHEGEELKGEIKDHSLIVKKD